MKHEVFRFCVVLAGLTEMSEDAAEALYEAGCDDSLCRSSQGIAEVAFHREAPSLQEAIRSAVRDVRKAGFEVERVEIRGTALAELVDSPVQTHA